MSKIVNLCICGPYMDGYTYQDNLLPKYQKRLGNEVTIITSTWHRDSEGKLFNDIPCTYVNADGIKVIRLRDKNNKGFNYKFKYFPELMKQLIDEKPDILFIHGVQFIDMITVCKYLKKHTEIKAFADNHADFSNSATNPVSKYILHGIIWRLNTLVVRKYIYRFWGTLPARVDFLVDIYGIPKQKTGLLIMGADDDMIDSTLKNRPGKGIRKCYRIKDDELLIVTGGKIDLAKKQTLLLMKAVKEIEKLNVRLIVFGSVVDEIKAEFDGLVDGYLVQYAGWITSDESFAYFDAADLVVFPGRHSVFWEQAAGQGKPMLCKYWEGTTHVDMGGNCDFLYEDNVEEMKDKLIKILEQQNLSRMKERACEIAPFFRYSKIAEASIRL